jgi:hypothetical protein
MALEAPAWCKQCGVVLQLSERAAGCAREFCGDACRQAFNRQVRLRSELKREVGLDDERTDRLLATFHVSRRRDPAARKRDTAPSRSVEGPR